MQSTPSARLGALAIFVAAAVLEVVGDAMIRKGMRGSGLWLIAIGFLALGTYGIVVNLLSLRGSSALTWGSSRW